MSFGKTEKIDRASDRTKKVIGISVFDEKILDVSS